MHKEQLRDDIWAMISDETQTVMMDERQELARKVLTSAKSCVPNAKMTKYFNSAHVEMHLVYKDVLIIINSAVGYLSLARQ